MALTLVAIMIMAMAVTAQAASITIKSTSTEDGTAGASETTEYTYYEIFKADIDSSITTDPDSGKVSGNGVAYYVTSSTAAEKVAATGVFTVGEASANGTRYYVELVSGKGIDDIKTALASLVSQNVYESTGTFAQTEPGGEATASDVDPGYYYITSTLGDEVVVETLADVTINTKNDYPTVEKEIDSDDANSQIGTTVTYTLTVTVPFSANDTIVLTDEMNEGLTFDSITSVKNASDADVAYTLSPDTAAAITAADNTFTITFAKAAVEANKGGTIVVTYKALVNEKAAIETDIPNEVKLDYGQKYTTVPSEAKTKTYKFTFDKVDGSSNKLADAKFELQLDGSALSLVEVTKGSEYRIATPDEIDAGTSIVTKMTTTGNTITVKGLDSDVTYTLHETEAPKGFNLAADETVSANDNVFPHINVVDQKGSVLPSTGGIGTTIFYVIGALLVLGAGILLVTKRRMSVEK